MHDAPARPHDGTDVGQEYVRAVQPRPHQVAALADLTRALAVHDRTQLVMACGTGKTLVGRWYAQSSEANRILVMLPSLGLVAQTLREWRRANRGSSWRFNALEVCSDPTTAEGAAERAGDADEDVIPLEEGTWEEVEARVTTSVRRAADWLQRRSDQVSVVFSTYHSSPVVSEAQQGNAAEDRVLHEGQRRVAGGCRRPEVAGLPAAGPVRGGPDRHGRRRPGGSPDLRPGVPPGR